jgi:hypothetical protein
MSFNFIDPEMSSSTTIPFLDFTSAYLLVKAVTFDDHINFRIYETYLEYLVSLNLKCGLKINSRIFKGPEKMKAQFISLASPELLSLSKKMFRQLYSLF